MWNVKDEDKQRMISLLEKDVVLLERYLVMENYREIIVHTMIRESQGRENMALARYVFMKEDDLNHEECKEYYQEVILTKQEIAH